MTNDTTLQHNPDKVGPFHASLHWPAGELIWHDHLMATLYFICLHFKYVMGLLTWSGPWRYWIILVLRRLEEGVEEGKRKRRNEERGEKMREGNGRKWWSERKWGRVRRCLKEAMEIGMRKKERKRENERMRENYNMTENEESWGVCSKDVEEVKRKRGNEMRENERKW